MTEEEEKNKAHAKTAPEFAVKKQPQFSSI